MRLLVPGICGVLAALLVAASTALANWQNTKWGMSQAEVLALYPNAMVMPPSRGDPEDQTNLMTSYSTGDFSFYLRFVFRHGGLAKVMLDSRGSTDCRAIRIGLERKYGREAAKYDNQLGSVLIWRNGTDQIGYGDTSIEPGKCSIVYLPLIDANNKGL